MSKFSFKLPLALLVMSGTTFAGLTAAVTTSTAFAATGGTVTITEPQSNPMTTLDPSQWAAQILVDQGALLEGLYGYNQKNQVVPKIASGYKVSKDGRTWTITLRKDAKWSNGDPVTAHDFYYAWMRQLAPTNSNAQLWLSVLNNVVNSYAYHSGGAKASAVGLKVLNNYTIQITTNTPHYILGELALAGSMPLDQKVVDAHPTDWYMPENFVGNGPYVVKSFTPNGELTMVRNPKYVGVKGEVNVGNASTINVVPGTTVPVEDFLAKKVDVALIGTTSDLAYVKSHNLSSELHVSPQYSIEYLQWDNTEKASPLNKLRVRQAIAEALQRQPIVKSVLSGMGGVTNTFSTPGWATAKYEKGLPENVTNARKLLASAGYANGKGLPIVYLYAPVAQVNQQGLPVAEAIAQELKQNLNINTKIVELDQTDDSFMTYGGPMKNVKPGFNIASSATNWSEPSSLDMGATQGVYSLGTYGYSPAFTQHVYPWYNNPYDPASLKKYGDINNANEGVKFSDWTALNKAAKSDIAYINKWVAKQPLAWRKILNPPGALTNQQKWNGIVASWKSAKTPAAKHAAYQLAWKFIAPYSAGQATGGMDVNSLDVQVYWDKHEPNQVKNWRMWQAEFANNLSFDQAAPIAGKLVTQLTQKGYTIPLFFNESYYLQRSNVTGAQVNPWAWGNFYQMQYLSTK